MQPDRHVRRSGHDYAIQFSQLLPRGMAWPRRSDSVLMQLVSGLAEIWGYVDGRAADLLERESDPRLTIELLEDWERNWGLPDPCYKAPQTIPDRQIALVQRMTIEGAQSRQFFIDVAASIGYKITITEYRPFMVGLDAVGDNRALEDYPDGPFPCQIGAPEMRYYWSVNVGEVRLTWFRATAGELGVDHHLEFGLADDLECLLRRWKPAHTEIIFDYSGTSPQGPMAGTP